MPRILVIDDNADDRTIMSALLYYNGFDVDEASCAADGVQLAGARMPDAIVMDVIMPGVNGLLATEILKSIPATAHVPVLCVSGNDIPARNAEACGAMRFMRKPLEPASFVNAIYDMIAVNRPPSDPIRG